MEAVLRWRNKNSLDMRLAGKTVASAWVQDCGDYYCLWSVQTDPGHRGKGYASRVVRKLSERFPDKPMWLSCHPEAKLVNNDWEPRPHSLVEWYHHLGFTEQGPSRGMRELIRPISTQ